MIPWEIVGQGTERGKGGGGVGRGVVVCEKPHDINDNHINQQSLNPCLRRNGSKH